MSMMDRAHGAAWGVSLGRALEEVDWCVRELHRPAAEDYTAEIRAEALVRSLRKALKEAEMVRHTIKTAGDAK